MIIISTASLLEHLGIALAFVVCVAVLIFVMITDNDDDDRRPPYA